MRALFILAILLPFTTFAEEPQSCEAVPQTEQMQVESPEVNFPGRCSIFSDSYCFGQWVNSPCKTSSGYNGYCRSWGPPDSSGDVRCSCF